MMATPTPTLIFSDFLIFWPSKKISGRFVAVSRKKPWPGDNKRPWKGVYFEAIPENCQKIRKVLETGLLKGNNKQTNQPTNQPTNQHDMTWAWQTRVRIIPKFRKTEGWNVNLRTPASILLLIFDRSLCHLSHEENPGWLGYIGD